MRKAYWSLLLPLASLAQPRPPALHSPEVHPDRTVTFRLAAPKAAVDFAKTHERFVIIGGAMGKTALDPNGVKALAAPAAATPAKRWRRLKSFMADPPLVLLASSACFFARKCSPGGARKARPLWRQLLDQLPEDPGDRNEAQREDQGSHVGYR